MKDFTWKNWLGWGTTLFVVWLGAYIFYWVDRAGCRVQVPTCMGDAFVNWAGDVVMLRWVRDYQPLIAGLATLAGAGAVLWVAGRDRRDRNFSEQVNKLERVHNTLHLVFGMAERLDYAIIAEEDMNALANRFDEIGTIALSLPTLAFDISWRIVNIANAAAAHCRVNALTNVSYGTPAIDVVRRAAFALKYYMLMRSRFFEGPRVRHSPYVLIGEDLENAKRLGISPNDETSIILQFSE